MSVLLDTSAGEIVIDLFTKEAPIASENFLKLCKIKFYNCCLFYNVQANYLIQTGDPTATGKGGQSVYSIIRNDPTLTFINEITKSRKINKIGLVCMASEKENCNRSQFFITLRAEDMEHLDGKHTVVGEVAEGFDVLEKLNSLYCDGDGRPYQDVRIKHTYILDDPYLDPETLKIPSESPDREIPRTEKVKPRIPYGESLEIDNYGKTEEEIEMSIKRKEAYSRALVLEMTGDIPDVEVKPPREVLFVCKLNPVTTDADLELIFSRFGKIKQCEIIRDFKTGESLNYAFIEYETENACIEAYEKMNNVLIDDRRIKVDFSQSVSKLWNKFLLRPRKDVKSELLHLNQTTTKISPRYSNTNNMTTTKTSSTEYNKRNSSNNKDLAYNNTKSRHEEDSIANKKNLSSEKNTSSGSSNSNRYTDNDKYKYETMKSEVKYSEKDDRRKRSRSRSRDTNNHHDRDRQSYRDKEKRPYDSYNDKNDNKRAIYKDDDKKSDRYKDDDDDYNKRKGDRNYRNQDDYTNKNNNDHRKHHIGRSRSRSYSRDRRRESDKHDRGKDKYHSKDKDYRGYDDTRHHEKKYKDER